MEENNEIFCWYITVDFYQEGFLTDTKSLFCASEEDARERYNNFLTPYKHDPESIIMVFPTMGIDNAEVTQILFRHTDVMYRCYIEPLTLEQALELIRLDLM